MHSPYIEDLLKLAPNRKNEQWKYSTFKSFQDRDYQINCSGSYEFSQETLTIIDSPQESFENEFVKVEVSDFSAKKWNKAIAQDISFLTSHAHLKSTYTVHLKKDCIVNQKFTKNELYLIDMIFIAENHSLLHKLSSNGSPLIAINMQQQGSFEYICLNDIGDKGVLLLNTTTKVESEMDLIHIHLSPLFTRHNLYSEINELNGELSAHGLYLLDDNSHVDTNSYIQHLAVATTSNQLYKTVLKGSSRGVFTGRIVIEKDMQLSNANQLNKNLILSDKAQANSRPQLEIFADDVKCAHGSTTGQISEEEMFYLEARGIKKEQAYSMLSKAFINEVIFLIKNKKHQRQVFQRVFND